MDFVSLHPASPHSAIRPPFLAVYVDGQRRRDVHVDAWTILPAPAFGKATVTMAMGRRFGPDRRIEDLARLPAVGARLQIRLPAGWQHALFDGVVTRHLGRVGPEAEQLAAEADDALSVLLAAPLTGRWQVSDGAPALLPTGAAVFNDRTAGLASVAISSIRGRPCRIFQPAPDGQPWSVADILAYLFAAHMPADVAVPGPDELDALGGAIVPRRLSLAGVPAAEAMARVAGLAGLAVRGGLDGSGQSTRRGLLTYRPGRGGRRRPIRLQQAGHVLDPRGTNLWKARVAVRRRPSRRGIVVLGGLKRYESTFILQPGWDPTAESYHYRDFVRDEAADWPAVADVFRKWVLNESGRYSAQPYSLPAFDFATISADDFLLSIDRGLEACLSVGPGRQPMGVVVEVSCDDGATWRRYGGPVRVASDECAVHLADDALPADYFQAAVDHLAAVRVTATVVSDTRLRAEVPGDPGWAAHVVDIPSAAWAKVHAGSVFCAKAGWDPPEEADDSDRLAQIASRLAESDAGAIEAELALGWLDPTCSVGDIVEGIDGRRLDLAVFDGAAPSVRAIEHRAGDEQTTVLTVSG